MDGNNQPWGLPGIPNFSAMIPNPSDPSFNFAPSMQDPSLAFAFGADGQLMPKMEDQGMVKEEDVAAAVADAMAGIGGAGGAAWQQGGGGASEGEGRQRAW
ncbi:hypothetical protein DUNSADRAFT_13888 [Dunaliella salina]|uniref:Encoded protein n=1 Tax=Dunaliella salina TaxID=3046 RepID=A0ABQ7H308_DUNSA|nr:hypothetical protein DUNSADRAFT_13888 [Dunaliella salina]KAF5841244.1 hypothetical protein DUNSADRAFT_13888 [Dunaliella salina]|eukprot:KAF5841243.1 hypothetical protein DUNSADRAFT_13888 [Dunaliella salina]